MYFPTLKELPASRKKVDVFMGYNHNLRIGDGEFYEMQNMTSDFFPALAPRGKRGMYASPEKVTGMIAKDQLCYVDGTAFVIGSERVEMGLSEDEKQLISMGAYVIILPDRKYINTMDVNDRGDIDASFHADEVIFETCNADGEVYDIKAISVMPPEEPEDGELWLDKSVKPGALMRYAQGTGMWAGVGITYVKITAPGIGLGFEKGDGVDISDAQAGAVFGLNGNRVLAECFNDYILIQGIVDTPTGEDAPESPSGITVERRMPRMDFMTESNNRLWGCRYGIADNGEFVNEIYACKLGDFKNWRCFAGISTDSYIASCGSDGPFTGAITHGGNPLLFKENHLHKVYGSAPSSFRIQSTPCRGVQKGSHRSLAIVNETLFYQSGSGVCAYDGSLPVEASQALGNERYSGAVGGSHGNKYYISMADKEGKYHLFVLDTAKKLWHREDDLRVFAFASWQGQMYAVDGDSGKIITLLGGGEELEKKVKWMVQTGPMGTESPDTKYISKLQIRMSLGLGTRVRILAQYNSLGGWDHLGTIVGTNLRTFSIPVLPVRCDHLRLRLDGEGEATIYSITRTIAEGSDIP